MEGRKQGGRGGKGPLGMKSESKVIRGQKGQEGWGKRGRYKGGRGGPERERL